MYVVLDPMPLQAAQGIQVVLQPLLDLRRRQPPLRGPRDPAFHISLILVVRRPEILRRRLEFVDGLIFRRRGAQDHLRLLFLPPRGLHQGDRLRKLHF